jgi:guanylate kinase
MGRFSGVDYHFVSTSEFREMVLHDAFIEHAEVHGNLYGTSRIAIEKATSSALVALLVIDWQGAVQVRRIYPRHISIFVLPPSLAALRSRLSGRGRENSEVIEQRLRDAESDMMHAVEFDHTVVNDIMCTAANQIEFLTR